MADPTYNVYLSTDKDDPDEGDDGVDFIHFVCKTTSPSLSNSNIREHMAGHQSIKANTGDFKWKCILQECIFKELGSTKATPETKQSDYNHLVKFISKHLMSDGDTIYLWIYDPFGDGNYFEWFDDDEDMQYYLRCTISSLRFSFDAVKRTIIGIIQLEEVWKG